jgi:hypothetical protein
MVDSWLPAARARRLARLGIAAFFVIGLLQLGLLVGVAAFMPEGRRQALTVRIGDHPVGQFGQVVLVFTWILNAVVTILTGIQLVVAANRAGCAAAWLSGAVTGQCCRCLCWETCCPATWISFRMTTHLLPATES